MVLKFLSSIDPTRQDNELLMAQKKVEGLKVSIAHNQKLLDRAKKRRQEFKESEAKTYKRLTTPLAKRSHRERVKRRMTDYDHAVKMAQGRVKREKEALRELKARISRLKKRLGKSK